MNTAELQKALDGLWNIRDVARLFGKTAMTLNTWRQQHPDFPVIAVPGDRRPAIRFVPEDVLIWAMIHDIPFDMPKKRYHGKGEWTWPRKSVVVPE